ncbi:MAG TPA: hypothetical protein VGA69_00025 [Nitriliruptorales bacterium]
MAASERARHDLYEQLTGLLGDEGANTLMEGLHPRPWDEIVTKHYLDERLDQLRDQLRAQIHETATGQTRVLVFSMIGAILTVAVIAFGA